MAESLLFAEVQPDFADFIGKGTTRKDAHPIVGYASETLSETSETIFSDEHSVRNVERKLFVQF
jgi:hypothetical protein